MAGGLVLGCRRRSLPMLGVGKGGGEGGKGGNRGAGLDWRGDGDGDGSFSWVTMMLLSEYSSRRAIAVRKRGCELCHLYDEAVIRVAANGSRYIRGFRCERWVSVAYHQRYLPT